MTSPALSWKSARTSTWNWAFPSVVGRKTRTSFPVACHSSSPDNHREGVRLRHTVRVMGDTVKVRCTVIIRAPDVEGSAVVQGPELGVVPVNLDDLLPAVRGRLGAYDILRRDVCLHEFAYVGPDPKSCALLVHVGPRFERYRSSLSSLALRQVEELFSIQQTPHTR